MKPHVEQTIAEIHDLISSQTIAQKEHLNLREAAQYLGVSLSYIYKKTSRREGIPFYRLGNKLIYFRRSELDAWLLSNRQNTQEEIALNAAQSLTQKRNSNAS
ncbi:MAG: helix-turn-helix domain-containing protein [Sediminibacterium sp.]|uniref:helix-turn-helix transcriptional regulator n=1 Tax=Sediminibacterium sp. TaxID=1917865 RepID=UPI002728380B|nr:helix-turn-helix domain-containing protein [Sediminibacterium sp.]MDO8996495.1 helix-turn-helix domain-containing protein [Sediminibacterium sp.]